MATQVVRYTYDTDVVKVDYSEYLRNVGLYSHTNRVTSNFVFKFRNFRYHGNEGRSRPIIKYYVELCGFSATARLLVVILIICSN